GEARGSVVTGAWTRTTRCRRPICWLAHHSPTADAAQARVTATLNPITRRCGQVRRSRRAILRRIGADRNRSGPAGRVSAAGPVGSGSTGGPWTGAAVIGPTRRHRCEPAIDGPIESASRHRPARPAAVVALAAVTALFTDLLRSD